MKGRKGYSFLNGPVKKRIREYKPPMESEEETGRQKVLILTSLQEQ